MSKRDQIVKQMNWVIRSFMDTVKVGDRVTAEDDKIFTASGRRFCTAGKSYVVEHQIGKVVMCSSDMSGHSVYFDGMDVTEIVRGDVKVWDREQEWEKAK